MTLFNMLAWFMTYPIVNIYGFAFSPYFLTTLALAALMWKFSYQISERLTMWFYDHFPDFMAGQTDSDVPPDSINKRKKDMDKWQK